MRKVAGYRARAIRSPNNPPHLAAPEDRDTVGPHNDIAATDPPSIDSKPASRRPRVPAGSGACPPSVPGKAPSAGEALPVGPALLYTAEQAGSLLAVPGSWLRKKAAGREIPCRYLGKHLRFALADLTTIVEMAAQLADHRDTTVTGETRRHRPSPPERSRGD